MIYSNILVFLGLIYIVNCCIEFKESSLKHGKRIGCEIRGGIEYSDFECDHGYEFKANVTKKSLKTKNGHLEGIVQCNPIGCKIKEMPTPAKIDPKYNLVYKSSKCEPAILENHCVPEKSYVDFECAPGLKLDEQYGFLHVQCLNSYLWDTIPKCTDGSDDDDDYDDGGKKNNPPADYNDEEKPKPKPADENPEPKPNPTTTPLPTTTTTTTPLVPTTSKLIVLTEESKKTTEALPDAGIKTSTKKIQSQDNVFIQENTAKVTSGQVQEPILIIGSNSPKTTSSISTQEIITTNNQVLNTTSNSDTSSLGQQDQVTTTLINNGFNTTVFNNIITKSIGQETNSSLSDNLNFGSTQKPLLDENAKLTSSFPSNKGIGCILNYNTPKNYENSTLKFDLIKSDQNDIYLPGSKVRISCKQGFYIRKTEQSQTTECLSDGTWTPVLDCENHPCRNKLPKRPLNGKRDAFLVFNYNGLTNNSYVKFSCNEFFERVGREIVYCIDYEWEKEIPLCRLRKDLCQMKPPVQEDQTYLKSLSRVEVKIEQNYNDTEKINVYTVASYVCKPGALFEDKLKTNSKLFGGVLMSYQNVTCIGPNKWEPVPKCL